jgi:hypothetical protein
MRKKYIYMVTRNKAILGDNANGHIVADAIFFELVDECDNLSHVNNCYFFVILIYV